MYKKSGQLLSKFTEIYPDVKSNGYMENDRSTETEESAWSFVLVYFHLWKWIVKIENIKKQTKWKFEDIAHDKMPQAVLKARNRSDRTMAKTKQFGRKARWLTK